LCPCQVQTCFSIVFADIDCSVVTTFYEDSLTLLMIIVCDVKIFQVNSPRNCVKGVIAPLYTVQLQHLDKLRNFRLKLLSTQILRVVTNIKGSDPTLWLLLQQTFVASLVLTQSSGTNRQLTGVPQVKQHFENT